MKNTTINNRFGRNIRDTYRIPYQSRNGNYAGTRKMGVDKDGKPEYKYLRLKHVKSMDDFFRYYTIAPKPNAWKRFRQSKCGKASYQKLQVKINQNQAHRATKNR